MHSIQWEIIPASACLGWQLPAGMGCSLKGTLFLLFDESGAKFGDHSANLYFVGSGLILKGFRFSSCLCKANFN